jgi:hypothetical protein
MTCRSCGTTITEQTFTIYRKRCVPCFNRFPIPHLKEFCEFSVVLVGLLLYFPVYITFRAFRRLWRSICPLPFKSTEIVRLMTPHFGYAGAIKYLSGLKNGFQEDSHLKRCCCVSHISSRKKAATPSIFYAIGQEDGTMLRRRPRQVQQILERRCSAPYKNKSRNKITIKRDNRQRGITFVVTNSVQRQLQTMRKFAGSPSLANLG